MFGELLVVCLQALFQIALAVLDANRRDLLAVDDDGEAMSVLGKYLGCVTNRDSTKSSATVTTAAAVSVAHHQAPNTVDIHCLSDG